MSRPTLNQEFAKQLQAFAAELRKWGRQTEGQLLAAHKRIGQQHRREAVQRVPVDEGRLRQGILTNTFKAGDLIVTETGTNIPGYPVFVEFGTEHIAGGRVLALGESVEITDAEAIKLWPAKNADLVSNKTGKANKRAINAILKRLDRGGGHEQMPWLRASFWKIRDWAIQQLSNAMRPLGSRGA